MPILNFKVEQVGQAGVFPSIIYILTNDTLDEVTATGYLNGIVRSNTPLSDADMALVTTKTTENASSTQVGWFSVIKAGENWSLTATTSPGNVILPTTANHIATYTDTLGTLSEDPATAYTDGNLTASGNITSSDGNIVATAGNITANDNITSTEGNIVASEGDITAQGNITATQGNIVASEGNITSTQGTITADGNITSTQGNIVATEGDIIATMGNVQAGSNGQEGTLISFPSSDNSGTLIVAAVNAGGAYNTTISNSEVGQSSVISVPDPGASTANFLLSTGTNNILSFDQFIGLTNIILISTGTWTTTRIAAGNYATVHTAAANTSIIGIDVTNAIRTATSKGFMLNSFDVIYSIGTLAMNAHTVTLNQIVYANDVAVAINAVTLTGSLSTATQANPYVTNIAVATPAFNNTADSKYVIEVTTNNTATTAYSFYGLMLYFSQTIA